MIERGWFTWSPEHVLVSLRILRIFDEEFTPDDQGHRDAVNTTMVVLATLCEDLPITDKNFGKAMTEAFQATIHAMRRNKDERERAKRVGFN